MRPRVPARGLVAGEGSDTVRARNPGAPSNGLARPTTRMWQLPPGRPFDPPRQFQYHDS